MSGSRRLSTSWPAATWDVVVVGGGHNGLTCAAYLAQAGRSVLVLEQRERLGGACTLEQPFADPGYVVSPCAYVVGLLDQRVIDELSLRRHGYKVFIAEPLLWCPFDDGTWYGQFLDPERTASTMRDNGFAESDIKGQFEYEDFFDRMRQALRVRVRDTWVGESPGEDELRELLEHDSELVDALFESSMADVIDRYITDPRLQQALYGQGIIGASGWAAHPGHGLDQADALPGHAGGRPDGVGVRRGRHGPHLVRHRRGGDARRGRAGGRRPGRRDPSRRGRRARRRRGDPRPGRRVERRPQGHGPVARPGHRGRLRRPPDDVAHEQPGRQGQLRPDAPAAMDGAAR